MIKIALNPDGSNIIGGDIELVSRHTSAGESKTVPVYLINDGKRAGVPSEAPNTMVLLYSNLKVSLEGKTATLQQELQASTSDVIVELSTLDGFGIGTILQSAGERFKIDAILSNKTVQVTRNYTADSGLSVINTHSVGEVFTAETTSVALALPSPNNYEEMGTFVDAGKPLTKGLNPTYLATSIDGRDTSTLVKSSSGIRYHRNAIIQIDEEQMKVVSIDGNNLTVVRGYNGTTRANHSQNAIIYLVGIANYLEGTDVTGQKTYKVFLKISPPAKLPTQRLKAVNLVISCDEEAL